MADRLRRAGLDRAVGAQHDRCGWRLLRRAKRAPHRQHDMHPRRLDALHQLHRARDLAFQRPELGDFLHERGQAERADLVEQLVAGIGAGRQPLLGQQHPRLHGLARAHRERVAGRIDVEGDVLLAQRGAHARHVFAGEAGIERLEFRPAQIVRAADDGHENGKTDQAQGHQASRPKLQQIVEQLLYLRTTEHMTSYQCGRTGHSAANLV
ncbi:hypothetical protein AB7M75_005026 [Bradyrhizobium ottawaense]